MLFSQLLAALQISSYSNNHLKQWVDIKESQVNMNNYSQIDKESKEESKR
jgi:hypothetical protein